jgi:hypothetical protein
VVGRVKMAVKIDNQVIVDSDTYYGVRYRNNEGEEMVVGYDSRADAEESDYTAFFGGEVVKSHHYFTEWIKVAK